MEKRFVLMGWLIALGAACGGRLDGQGGGSAGGTAGTSGISGQDTVTLTAACQEFSSQLQGYAERCGQPPPPDVVTAAFVQSCVGLASLPGSSVTVATLQACAATTAVSTSCRQPPACLSYQGIVMPAAPGTLPLGATCQAGMQCASGSCSRGKYSVEPGGCGVCQQVHGLGDSCAPPEHACDEFTECRQGVCAWPGPDVGSPCVNYGADPCGLGLNCVTPSADVLKGVCQPRPGLGQPCHWQQEIDCATGLACDEDLCVALLPDGASCGEHAYCQNYCHEGICQSPQTKKNEGESCSFFPCDWGLLCSPEQICRPAQLVSEGEACGGLQQCAPGLVCSKGYLPEDPPGRCVKEPGPGEPCQDLYCDRLSHCGADIDLANNQPGTCVARGLVGQPCPCIGELICDQEICRPFGTLVCP